MPTVSARELANRLGFHERRISQLVHEGMPKIGHGKYDLDVCLDWVATRREEAARLPPDVERQTLAELRADLIRLQCAHQELRNQKERNELITDVAAQRAYHETVAALVDEIQQWVSQARTNDEQAMRQRLAKALRDRLAGRTEDIAVAFGRSSDPASASIRLSGSVGG